MLACSRTAGARHAISSAAQRTVLRDFKKKAAPVLKKQSKADTGGRDPYATFKAAIAAVPDPEKVAAMEIEDPEARKARLKEYSRQARREQCRIDGHLTRLIRLREKAIAALPEELQAEARQPDYTPFPVQRRVFTETPPIPDFQTKLSRREVAS